MVERAGLERALAELYAAGVFVTQEEFKGRQPIRRPGLEFVAHSADFDNPVTPRDYEAQTGGSSGAVTTVVLNLDLMAYESIYLEEVLHAFNAVDRPVGLWRSVPPISTGLSHVLRFSRLEVPIDRWFSQNRSGRDKHAVLLESILETLARHGRLVPSPEYVPQGEAVRVARWLAEKRRQGNPALLDTNASAGVRVCLAASAARLDIGGTLLVLGSEPYTAAKARVVADVGASAISRYSMTEVGNVGTACAAAAHHDDLHLLTDKLALIRPSPGSGGTGSFCFTTVLRFCPKLMINVDSGDSGNVELFDCGCPIGELGLTTHLSRVRSHRRFTGEGMNYFGGDLLKLVDEVLPRRFGGHPTDYQLVEEEEHGVTKVSIVIAPGVGELNESAVIMAAHDYLSEVAGGRALAAYWKDGETFRVVRRAPLTTSSAKILPLITLAQAKAVRAASESQKSP
jgi:hypothetical protein